MDRKMKASKVTVQLQNIVGRLKGLSVRVPGTEITGTVTEVLNECINPTVVVQLTAPIEFDKLEEHRISVGHVKEFVLEKEEATPPKVDLSVAIRQPESTS
jgi:hypothetical protein